MSFSPVRWWTGARQAHAVARGGGPVKVKVVRIGNPEGLIVPTSEVELEITRRDGSVVRMQPQIPLPFLWSWAYRLAQRLGVPLVSDLDLGRIAFELRVPGR
jgi:hypothetical protein